MVDNFHKTTNAITDYHKGINTPTQSQQRNKTTDEKIFSRRGVPCFLFKDDNFVLTVVPPTLLHRRGNQGTRLVLPPIAIRSVLLINTPVFSNLFVIGSKFYMESFRRFWGIHKYMRQIYCRRGVYRY